MTRNRLAKATSPYLLQHQDNPVDWYEWGDEAFAAARERDVPVFLSVGYAACHWCHVMAHESFEDESLAAYLNEHFVSVKVDREERPDIDAVYMEVTQAMTGHGGWPMTCILTPGGEPFFAGTYFPPETRGELPAFQQVLSAIVTAWTDRRDEITKIGEDVGMHLRRRHELDPSRADDLGETAVIELARTYDKQFAGFGGAPKFPPSMVCEFLLRRAARVNDAEALRMAEGTLDAMARGGLYDQLGGGFARYSVDARWEVPHFEKMLYDNALLLSAYTHWYRLTDSALAERVARETADFMLRELRTPDGAFASALDADSDGEEGTYYVWTPKQLTDVLGATAGQETADLFAVAARGNFENGTSTLRLPIDPVDWCQHADRVRLLLDARAERTRPARDDKVVASWNGLAIAALAEAGVVLDEPRYVEVAESAADLLFRVHAVEPGRLRRVSRLGVVGEPAGILEDYACVAHGLLALFAATGDERWFTWADELVSTALARFDDGRGGFYDTADDSEVLLKRPQDPADNASPSGQAMLATVLVSMAALTGATEQHQRLDRLMATLTGLAERAPRFAGQTLAAWEARADGPRQVAVVGPDADARHPLVRAAMRQSHPGQVVAQGRPGEPTVALLADRPLVDGKPAAYACHDFVCELPVTDPALLS